MPSMFAGRRRSIRHCERPYRWSMMRGGCRFEPGHAGECKPGRKC